ncbi:MAG: GNAT family N-acetyltransferase [Bryobacteraceae bacterium]
MHCRKAESSDIPAMARIRAEDWGTEEYWETRISQYLACELHPQEALIPSTIYVALEGNSLVGFIAGHLTRRYACDGELEWINVIPERRGSGVSLQLLRLLAEWFAGQKALRICVDVDPANAAARRFYTRNGADKLNEHWLVWNDIGIVRAKMPFVPDGS